MPTVYVVSAFDDLDDGSSPVRVFSSKERAEHWAAAPGYWINECSVDDESDRPRVGLRVDLWLESGEGSVIVVSKNEVKPVAHLCRMATGKHALEVWFDHEDRGAALHDAVELMERVKLKHAMPISGARPGMVTVFSVDTKTAEILGRVP